MEKELFHRPSKIEYAAWKENFRRPSTIEYAAWERSFRRPSAIEHAALERSADLPPLASGDTRTRPPPNCPLPGHVPLLKTDSVSL